MSKLISIISIKVKHSEEWTEFHRSEDSRIIDATIEALKTNPIVNNIKLDVYELSLLASKEYNVGK